MPMPVIQLVQESGGPILLFKSESELQRDSSTIWAWWRGEWDSIDRRHSLIKAHLSGDVETLSKVNDCSEVAMAKVDAGALLVKAGTTTAAQNELTTITLRKIAELFNEYRRRVDAHDELTERSRRFRQKHQRWFE